MQVSKKEGKILDGAIKNWLETDIISESESEKLQSSYDVIPFDWKRVAKYSFWVAIICIVISVASVLANEWVIDLFMSLFDMNDFVKSLLFFALSGGLYFLGIKRKYKYPEKIYSNEAIFFLGILTTAGSIALLGNAMDKGTGHFSLLLLLAALVYGLLGLWFPSKLVWLFSLISLGSWFGAETGYYSGWGAYYLGMNYPLRFILVGLVLIFCGSYIFNHWQSRSEFVRPTRAIGLLYLFIALWILSLFGNTASFWHRAEHFELFGWSLLFAVAACASIYHGVKHDDGMTRGFGLTFLFINLYTKFFEYFWEDTDKAIFFTILALSFWYLGARAEKIWQMNAVKSKVRKAL
ncbi:MAG: hypothetical protein ACSHXJ_10005 [Marinomonas colpomeniae]